MPVKAPWEAPVEPIFIPALKTGHGTAVEQPPVFNGESFPKLSTIVIPGKTEDPNVPVRPTDWGLKGWAMVLKTFSRMKPNTSVTLKFGRMVCVLVIEAT